jgi:hypothetical protein
MVNMRPAEMEVHVGNPARDDQEHEDARHDERENKGRENVPRDLRCVRAKEIWCHVAACSGHGDHNSVCRPCSRECGTDAPVGKGRMHEP